MTANKRFSKKHKQLIKDVERLLGSLRAFYVDMTQGNHLVFYIEGIDKPMYTSGTPSDRNAYTNFISDLKRAITADEPIELSQEEQEEQNMICTDQIMERCIVGCAQVLRQRKAQLNHKEAQEFAEHGDIDKLAEHRMILVKEQIEFQLKQRRETCYIKPKMMRILLKQVRHHLDFLLPSLSTYRHQQKTQEENSIASSKPVMETEVALAVNDAVSTEPPAMAHKAAVLELCHAGGPVKTKTIEKKPKEIIKPVSKKEQLRQQIEQQHGHLKELAQISSLQRINLFRNLSKNDMLSLIDDLQQAMQQNEAQAIDEILAKVKEFGLPKDVLIERLQKA